MLRALLLLTVLTVSLGTPVVAQQPQSNPLPKAVNRLPDRALSETSASRSEQLNALAEKQKLLEELQRDIANSEEELGISPRYNLHAVAIEFDAGQLKKTPNPLQDADGRSITLEQLTSSPWEARNLSLESFQRFLTGIQQSKKCKLLAESTLPLRAGIQSSMNSGGEFPVSLPQNGKQDPIEWRQFGVRFEGTIVPRDDDRVTIKVSHSVSERDFNTAVHLKGVTIPGISKRETKFETTLRYGETAVIGMADPSKNTICLFAYTPSGGDE